VKSVNWSKIKTENDASAIALKVIQSFGLSGGVFSYTPIARLPNGAPGLIKRAMPINLDPSVLEEWLQHQNLLARDQLAKSGQNAPLSHNFDPIRRQMISRLTPSHFNFSEIIEDRSLTKNTLGIQWLRRLLGHGIRESYSVPVFTGLGEYWSLAAMRYSDSSETRKLGDKELKELHWLVVKLAEICIDKLGWRATGKEKIKRPLSPRELDSLYWAAKGKSAVETADILGLKPETVRQYLKTAIAKLHANNKTHAVCIAHQLGYLTLTID